MGIFDKLKDMLDGENEQNKDQNATTDSVTTETTTTTDAASTDTTNNDVQVDEWGTDLSEGTTTTTTTSTDTTVPADGTVVDPTTESGEMEMAGQAGHAEGGLLTQGAADEQAAQANAAAQQAEQDAAAQRAQAEAAAQAQAAAEQQAQADAAARAQAEAAAAAAAQPQQYTVVEGDTLWDISQTYGTSVDALVEANGIENPDLIFPGQVLTIPK